MGDTPNETNDPTIEDLQAQITKLTEEVDTWKGHSRTWENRAKENSEAATQVADLQAALEEKTSELTAKVTEFDDLTSSTSDLKSKLDRAKVALKFGLNSEDAELLTGDTESMEKLAARISGPRAPKPDSHQGRGDDPAPISPRDQFAAIFNN